MTAAATAGGPSAAELYDVATAIHGGGTGLLALFSGRRVPGARELVDVRSEYFAYPDALPDAAGWLRAETRAGRETYAAAHLVREQSRRKAAAAPVWSLWSDVDDGRVADAPARPTVVVESSPGRFQAYWRLTRPIEPAAAEALNKRMAFAIGADPSGFDLSQLLRVPGTANFKYPGAPAVEMVAHDPAIAHDPDELDRLLPPLPADKAKPERAAVAGDGSGDMPPVLLDAEAMATWRGERPKVKTDGSGQIDRSASLPKIGRALFDAGATRPTIERALAERDEALGWAKYTGRRDAGEQYAKVVDLLEREGRRPRPTIRSATHREGDAGPSAPATERPDADDLPNDPGSLKVIVLEERRARRDAERERDELRATLARREEQRQLDQRVREAPNVQPEKDLIVALGWVYENATEVAPTIKRPDGRLIQHRTPDGFVRIRRGDLAGKTGKATRTITSHLGNIEKLGLVEVRREPERLVDPETGEVETIPDSTVIYFRPPEGDVRAMHRRAISATDEDRKAATGKANAWGGKRERRCPDHPDAALVTRTTVSCAECGLVIEEREQRPPAGQDDQPRQNAATGTDDAAPLVKMAAYRTSYPPSRGHGVTPRHLDQGVRDGEGAVASARADLAARRPRLLIAGKAVPTAGGFRSDDPPRAGCLDCGASTGADAAYCDRHGGGSPTLPGFDPPPPDRYTDVPRGGRE